MIERDLISLMISQTRKLTGEEVRQIRENGLGNGFEVLEPSDGYRQDDSLWFGKCSVCGETVTNSWLNGVWEHKIKTIKMFEGKSHTFPLTSTKSVDYCPTQVTDK